MFIQFLNPYAFSPTLCLQALFCILGWLRKLKNHPAGHSGKYTMELGEVLSIIPPLMNEYFCSRLAQTRWNEQMPWIADHYFSDLFERDLRSTTNIIDIKMKKKEEIEEKDTIQSIEGNQTNNVNQKDSKDEESMGTPDQLVPTQVFGKVVDPHFGSLGMELYKCIIIETMSGFPQYVNFAVDEMLKPLLVYTFGRDEQWMQKKIMTRINQKCALKITSILYHEVINKFQQTRGTAEKFVEPEYNEIIYNFSGLSPLKMFKSILQNKIEHKKEEKTE